MVARVPPNPFDREVDRFLADERVRTAATQRAERARHGRDLTAAPSLADVLVDLYERRARCGLGIAGLTPLHGHLRWIGDDYACVWPGGDASWLVPLAHVSVVQSDVALRPESRRAQVVSPSGAVTVDWRGPDTFDGCLGALVDAHSRVSVHLSSGRSAAAEPVTGILRGSGDDTIVLGPHDGVSGGADPSPATMFIRRDHVVALVVASVDIDRM